MDVWRNVSCCCLLLFFSLRVFVQIGKQIGRGHFGVVRLCVERATGKPFAVKSIAINAGMDRAQIQLEIRILREAGSHPNVVQLVDVFEDDKCFYMVMELLQGGDVLHCIIEDGRSRFPVTLQLVFSLFRTFSVSQVDTCQ